MNNVNIIGRCGSDPEIRYTPSGKAVTEINLAVDDGWGENKKTAWIGVTIWDKTAELAGKALHKGDRVAITGRLSQEEWEDKQTGKKQRKTKVTCENMTLLEPKRDGQQSVLQQRQNPHYSAPLQSQAAPQTAPAQGQEEDDIPF